MKRDIVIIAALILTSSLAGAYLGRDRRYTIKVLCCESLIEPYELITGYFLKLYPSYKVVILKIDICDLYEKIRSEKPDLIVFDDRFVMEQLLSENLVWNYTIFASDSLVICYKNSSWFSREIEEKGVEVLREARVAAMTGECNILGLRTRAFLKLALNSSLEYLGEVVECNSVMEVFYRLDKDEADCAITYRSLALRYGFMVYELPNNASLGFLNMSYDYVFEHGGFSWEATPICYCVAVLNCSERPDLGYKIINVTFSDIGINILTNKKLTVLKRPLTVGRVSFTLGRRIRMQFHL